MSNDFETVPCGTEQALREALELLGIEVEGSPVDTWKENKGEMREKIAELISCVEELEALVQPKFDHNKVVKFMDKLDHLKGGTPPKDTRDLCQHKWTELYPSGMVCIYCNKTIMTDIHAADLEGRN